jgi:repressor LexA
MELLAEYIEEHGYSPTMDELADRAGLAKPTIQQYLQALEQKGAISRTRYSHRSIEIEHPEFVPGGDDEIPLRGRIAAGSPIEPVESPETISVGDRLGVDAGGDMYALEVDGNSMIDEGIHDGDYVIVEKADTARDGQTVVAILPDGEATLKKLYREKGRIRLQPANPDLDPIYVDAVTVQGVVRGVIRVME